MVVVRKSPISGKTQSLDLNISAEQMKRYENKQQTGEFIQHIFPNLSPSEREFIKTGITPVEWNETFGVE